jgi:hypothetical protein
MFQLHRGGQFNWWSYPEKTINLQQGIAKLYYIILFREHIAMYGIRAYNFSRDSH